MKYFNFKKDEKEKFKDQLKKRCDDAKAILQMSRTPGWKLIETLLGEQLEAYKAELLVGCKNYEEYQEKRGKAWGISILKADLQDYIRMGEEASLELDKFKD